MMVAMSMVLVGFVQAQPRTDDLTTFWRTVFARPEGAETVPYRPAAKVHALGEALFSDPRLSGSGARSCASCHQLDRSFTDGRAQARATPGVSKALRNTPTLYNLALANALNWDGSAPTLEAQIVGPIQNRAELAGKFPEIVTRLTRDPEMVRAFKNAFPKSPTVSRKTIVAALAAYVRGLVAPRTKFDAWVAGDDTALTKIEKAGFKIFVGKGGCVACHSGWRLTDDGFHDVGLPVATHAESSDVAGQKGVRAFKTPTLRAVQFTGPYMHNGSFNSLAGVVDHYVDGIRLRKGLSASLPRDLSLSPDERKALVAFLLTL